MALNGLIFDRRNNTAKNWRSILAEIMGDGIIGSGCEVTSTSNSITVGGGHFILKGAVIENNGTDTIPVTPTLTDGYVRLICRIDLTQEASETGPGQVGWVTDFSATPTLPALTQEDINGTGSVYEGEIAVLQIVSGNIAGITRQIGAAEIDAEKLGGKLPEYYMPKIGGTFIGNVILNANYAFQCIGSGGMYWQLKKNGENLGAFCDVFEVLNKAGTAFAPIIASRYTLGDIGRVGPNGANLGLFANSTYVEILNSTGSAYATVRAAAFPVSSSVRYKNILGMMGREQAKKVLDLEFVKFTYKPEFNDDGGTVHFGAKAEQAHELGMEDIVSYDDEGMPTGIDYSKLTPYLGVVIQEQEKRIAKLENKNAALSALLVSKGILTQEEIDGLEETKA